MDKNKLALEILMGLGKALLVIAAIPGAIILITLLFRLNVETGELTIPLGWLPRIGPLLMVLLIYGVNVQVSHRIIERIRKDFYSGSITARKERAYREFYRHWTRGLTQIKNNPRPGVLLGQWDRDTMYLLCKYCSDDVLGSYKGNTHRDRFGEERALEPAYKDDSVDFIGELLDSDFEEFGELTLL